MKEQQQYSVGMAELIEAIKANTQSQIELAKAIRRQADAIADLAEAVTEQPGDDGPEDGLGHLGTL